jgi:hypothetical protein
MKKKTLYIIIAILVLLNIGQFVYFYSVVSDLKMQNEVLKIKTPEDKTDWSKYK